MTTPNKRHRLSIWDHFTLLIESPKHYLYSFICTNKDPLTTTKPFDPRTKAIALRLIKRLEKASLNIKVHLIGSTGLEIAGRGDIDLIASCHPSEFTETRFTVNSILGKADKIRRKFIEWKTTIEDREVDLTLLDPTSERFNSQLYLFNALKNDSKLLQEYIDLKESLAECSKREYVIRRMKFFNKIVKDTHNSTTQ